MERLHPHSHAPSAAPLRTTGRRVRSTRVLVGGLAALLLALLACGSGDHTAPNAVDERIRSVLRDREEPVLALATGDTVHLRAEVLSFYQSRGYEAAWTDEAGFLPQGEAVFEALHAATADGLSVESYHRDAVHNLLEQIRAGAEDESPVATALGTVDLLLTEAFLRYADDLARGTVDPEAAGLPWRIERGSAPSLDLLLSVTDGRPVEELLDSLRPQGPHYHRMKKTLGRYRAIAESGGWPTVPDGPPLSEGDRSPRVRALRTRLVVEGDSVEAPLARGNDAAEIYDADLTRAVRHFQERHGIAGDGAVGARTLEELNTPVEERFRSLRLNLDRWRWLPRDLGSEYVLVNVAGFELEVVRDRRSQLTMNVVVGQEAWQTPIFRDTMEYVVVNPYWNVPESIAEDEVLPAARDDVAYVWENDFQVLDASGRPLDPTEVNFHQADFPYSFRQRSGPKNALGDVKFLFPNEMNIYLHDTPADHLFTQDSRAFSHGCIRVSEPEELARYVLEHYSDRPPTDYAELRRESGEQWVRLSRPLPVYILYFTAWTDEDGTVHFHDDIYSLDSRVDPQVRQKLDSVVPTVAPRGRRADGEG